MDFAVQKVNGTAGRLVEDPPDLRELTSGLARGEEKAWQRFFDGYEVRLMGYIRICLRGNAASADDVFQETMMRVVRHVRPFAEEEAFWSWLTVVTRSVLADHGRKRSAWRRFLDRFAGDGRCFPATGTIGDGCLDRALGKLGVAERRLIERKYEERWTVRELAQDEGVTEKAIERRLAKARRRLGDFIKRMEKEDTE